MCTSYESNVKGENSLTCSSTKNNNLSLNYMLFYLFQDACTPTTFATTTKFALMVSCTKYFTMYYYIIAANKKKMNGPATSTDLLP